MPVDMGFDRCGWRLPSRTGRPPILRHLAPRVAARAGQPFRCTAWSPRRGPKPRTSLALGKAGPDLRARGGNAAWGSCLLPSVINEAQPPAEGCRECLQRHPRASAFVVRSKDLQSVFKGNFIDGTRYANNEAAPVSKSSSSSRGHAMSRIELHKRDANGDPVPTFATDAEIQAAEQLRHQLEEQYLTPRWASAPLSKGSDERQHR